MAIKGISSQNLSSYTQRITSNLNDLGVQLASGKKAETYGQLGSSRTLALSMRADIEVYEEYNDGIEQASVYLSSVQNVLTSLGDITDNARADFNGTALSLSDGSFEQVQSGSEQRLSEVVSLLNEEISGRYLFSGTEVDEMPVETVSNILDGTGNQAGLKQLIAEHKLADLGALDNGRLTVADVGNVVSISEDGIHEFGLKLDSVSQDITGLSITGPAGTPQTLDVDFNGAVPVEGEEITIKFTLPDGESAEIVLTAKSEGSSDKDGFVIGATDAENAANFQDSINEALSFLANGEMMAASAVQAADDFFEDPPQRVDGPPFDTAVAKVDGTDADTLSWYNGDDTVGTERDSYKVFASKNSTLSVGVRADEDTLKDIVKNLALMSAESFDPDSEESNEHYVALKSRVIEGLSDDNSETSTLELATELGYKENHLGNLSERNTTRINLSENILADVEGIDTYEVSAKILSLNTQLEMSYKVTSMLSEMHLINFI